MRRLLRALALLLGALLLLLLTALVVLRTPLGGELIRRAVSSGVSSLIAGSLELERATFGGFDEIVAHDVRLLDAEGRVVVHAESLSLSLEPLALLGMELSMPEVRLRRGTLTLVEGHSGLPTFLEALEPAEPSEDDSPSPLTARLQSVRIEELKVQGSLGGVDDIAIEDTTLEGSLTYLDDALTISIDALSGVLTSPVTEPLPLRGDSIVVDSRPEIGARLRLTFGEEGERATVALRYALPHGGAAKEELELEVGLHTIRFSTLDALGVPGVAELEGATSGAISLRGPIDALDLEGALEHEAGTLTLEGTIADETVVRVSSPRLEARRLMPTAPEIAPGFDATLTLREGRRPRAELTLSPLDVAGVKIPATRSSATLEDDRVDLVVRSTSLSTGSLSVEGSVHHDGELDLRVKARLSSVKRTRELRELLGDVEGGASVDARITGSLDAPRVRGGFVVAPFSYGPVQAARLSVSADLMELSESPSLTVDLDAKDVVIFGRDVHDVALTVRGRRGALTARGRLGADGEGRIDARFDLGDVFRLHRGTVDSGRFSLDARDVRVSRRETRIGSVHAKLGNGRLVASGVIRERGPDRAQVDLAGLLLSDIRAFVDLPFEALEGSLSLHAELEGDLQSDPVIFAQGALEGISGGGLEESFAGFFFQHRDGHSLGQVQVDLGERGSGALGVNAYLDLGRGDLEAAIADAYFEISADVFGFDLELTRPLLPEEIGEVSGHVDGSVYLAGLLDALEADARLETRNLRVFDLPELTYVLEVQRQYGSLTIDLAARDEEGLLGEVRASTVGNALAMLAEPGAAAESLALAPWLFRARLPERRVGSLPEQLTASLPDWAADGKLALSLDAQGGTLEPRVDAKGVVLLPAGDDAICGAARELSLPFRLRVRDGEATLTGELLLASRAAATFHAHAEPPLSRWLDHGELERVPVSGAMRLEGVRVGNLPIACEVATGDLSGELQFADLMGDAPRATAYLQSNSIRVRSSSGTVPGARSYDSPPLSLGATIGLDTELTRLDVTVRSGLHDRLRVDGTAPLALVPRGLLRFEEETPFSLFVDVENAPLAVLLGFSPAFANVEGVADGWGRLGGTIREPVHHAELAIRDGRFTLTSLGQRVSDVEGVATLDPGRLALRHFRARDGDGRVTAEGELLIENLAPTAARLELELERFPVRDEGTIVAAITGRGALDANIGPELAEATLTLRDLDVTMPSLGAPAVQDLADHPDVRIVRAGDDEPEEEAALPFALRLHLDATEPFAVKGPDFEATLTADLRISLSDDSLLVGGLVELRGGRFSVLGKPFEVTAGSLRFDPRDETLSPAVSLQAVYLVNGDRNRRVTVSVGGNLSEPTVRFSSNVPTQNEGEIISLIVTGETHSETERGYDSAAAGRDAADFVAGVAFGVVSLSLREEFGGFLPVVTLEGQSRFRARFDAERFLPERVRRVVRRARIEGYFTAGQAGEEDQVRQTGQGRGSGFSIELGFPRGIVGRGTVAPPNNWSTQVLWEP